MLNDCVDLATAQKQRWEDLPSELSQNNLEEFLCHDATFVDYFNTFLSLPCFPERIFYNKENDLLEQFTQQLVKDECDNVQLKYDSSSDNVQISYCVTVLERAKALGWLNKYRVPEFIKSGLYGEYKLSKTLSSAQAVYVDTIKNDLSRAKSCDIESQSDAGELEEIFNVSRKTNTENRNCQTSVSTAPCLNVKSAVNNGERDLVRDLEFSERNSGISNTFSEKFSESFPSILVSEPGTISTRQDLEASAESSVASLDINDASSASDVSHDITESQDDVISVDDLGIEIEATVRSDVIGNDVIDDVTGNDVIGNDVMGNQLLACDDPAIARNEFELRKETHLMENTTSRNDNHLKERHGGTLQFANVSVVGNNVQEKTLDNSVQELESSTFPSKIPLPSLLMNEVEQSSSNEELEMLKNDTHSPFQDKSFNMGRTDNRVGTTTSLRSENTNKCEEEVRYIPTVDDMKSVSSDINVLEVEDEASEVDNENEENFVDRSYKNRGNSLTSNTSSDITLHPKRDSSNAEQEEMMDDNKVNLASKTGMDAFKEFLIDTKGEALLLFWLQVETFKHLGNSRDKLRVLQEMKEQFLRNGSPLELPNDVKKRARNFAADLSQIQEIVAQSLRSYWCPRFTLHQINSQTPDKLQQSYTSGAAKLQQRTWSTDLRAKSTTPGLMYPSTSPHLVRPHSCTPRETLRSSSPRETLKEGKPHARSKSAQGRFVSTPCHTNAGKKQLELYATPQPAQFGFQKRPISSFPSHNDPEYLSPVRLFISPRCKPKLRTAWPQRQEENSSTEQAYHNARQDSLMDSLTYQSESGCFFKKFVSKQNNQLWLNCLSFWQAVMDYTAWFESSTLDPVSVSRKAQWIYARFITSGSICDIKLASKTREKIRQKLDPPFEELFDCTEDHVLACLKEPWDSLCRGERQEYDMIPKKETVRYLEVKLKTVRGRSRNSFLQEELDSQDDKEHLEQGKYGIDEANRPLSMPQDGVSFESVIKDRDELGGFQKYLEKKDPKGVMDLMAWTDMETFQRIPRAIEDKRNKKAKEIRQGYLNSRYFFGPDSPATKEAQNLILSMNGSARIKERPSSSIITECQKYVRCRIERRWLALYKASEEYRERQNPKQNVSDVVEDIMLRRRLQRSEAAWRVLNSRWVSSSRDIVALRQTLNNPESCLAFRKFVALKGDTYENDVLFWIEIQKYKDLCHRHASEQCIKKKIQAITECFITSSIPPELQVDVPIEMAEKLMERITSRNQNIGPYLFREVQMTVFRVLFNMWKDFCTFRSSINDENLMKVLDKRLSQHRAEAKAKKEANERRRLAKQEAEKRRKEKEEKEKKELKSMEKLMSLMTESSTWEQEENEVVLWKYSKHIQAASEEALPRKKISTQDDETSFMELTNQRSIATKSTNQITSSIRSERNTGKVSKYKYVAPVGSYSGQSKHSTKDSTSRIPRITQSSHVTSHDITRYDIIDKNRPDRKQATTGKTKLLKNRERKKSKNILDRDTNAEGELDTSDTNNEARGKSPRVKSSRVKDPLMKYDRKNAPAIEVTKIYGSDGRSVVNERSGSLRTSVLRHQWNQSHDRNGSPVPLTSQLLQDFTNSPEGAPLATPLSLARINKSDDVIVGPLSDAPQKTAQATKIFNETKMISWRTKRERACRAAMEPFVPDVIVS